MYRKFDVYGNYEQPLLKLRNVNEEVIGILTSAMHVKITPKYVSYDELEFDIAKYYIDENGEKKITPYYELIKPLKQIEVDGFGVFVVVPQGTSETGDGIKTIKHVTCNSIEVVFGYRKLTNIEGVYPLYDPTNEKESILSLLLNDFKDWSIESVDADLWYINPHDTSKYMCRTYSESEVIWYDFLMNTVSQDFECVFTFDTFRKKIKVQTVANAIKKSDIFVNYQNVLKELTLESNASGVKCALNVYGANELEIDNVNPMGGSTIYNFSYFKNNEWMDNSTIDAVTRWEQKYDRLQPQFANLVTQMKKQTKEYTEINTSLEELKKKLDGLNVTLATKVEAQLKNINVSTQQIKYEISVCENDISNTQTSLNNKQTELDNTLSSMKNISNDLAFPNNFNNTQMLFLNNLFAHCTGDITFDCFVKTDSMTDLEVQEEAQRLYEHGVEALKNASQQNYTFSCKMINILSAKELEIFGSQIQLGSEFTFENDGNIFKPILLEYIIDFDDIKNSKAVFSTNVRYEKNSDTFANLFKGVTSTVNNVATSIYSWSDSKNATRSIISEMKKDTLDVVNKRITSSSGMCPTMDGSGIRIRKQLDDGTYDPKQMWMINNNIAMTTDNWNTTKLAIGELTIDGRETYGVCADKVVCGVIK